MYVQQSCAYWNCKQHEHTDSFILALRKLISTKEGMPGSSVLTVMLSHWHQRGVTCILKPSPTCKKSCLFTHISTLEAAAAIYNNQHSQK